MLTTNLVIAETLTMLGRRAGHHFAVERGRRFYQTESLTIVRPTAEMELAAIEQLDRYHDAECGFVDCLSFETMWHHKIDRVFTFDRHFALAGFTICP